MAVRLLTPQKIVNLSSDPGSGTSGELYYNTVEGRYKYYNGSEWIPVGANSGINSFTTISTPEGTGPVADLVSDTLTLLATNGMSISGSSVNDSVLFSTNATPLDTSLTIVKRDESNSFDISAIDFTTNASITASIARVRWDDGDGTLSFGLKGGNVDLKIGQEEVALCYNGTGGTLTKGTVVYINGSQGQRPALAKSNASSESTSSKTFGIVVENINNGAEGYVSTFGIVKGLNTLSLSEGSPIWLSTTAGEITSTPPTQPNHTVFLGYCVRSHASSGQIFVNIQNGYEIQELHNVKVASVAANDILIYSASTGLWENKNIITAITNLDGASSGIDADLLDGQHGSYYAPISSPSFSGVPTAPTAVTGTSTTQIATTAFVQEAVAAGGGGGGGGGGGISTEVALSNSWWLGA